MSDSSTTEPDLASSSADGAGPLAGQRLADARRANDISIADIAKELHLDEPKVQALEENQFDILGAPVFAKGHLRKYAELVGVPIDDILADYYQLNRAVGAPPVVGPKRRQPREISIGPWLIGVVVIIVAAGAAYWWYRYEPSTEVTHTPGVLEPFVSTTGESVAEEQNAAPEPAPDIEEAVVLPAASEEETTMQETVSLPDVQAAQAVDGEVALELSFSGDCWTEVTDANGSRLFFGLGQAGQRVTRSGMPPLRALFGDHNNVSVTLNGADFPISGDGRRGNTARVTLDTP